MNHHEINPDCTSLLDSVYKSNDNLANIESEIYKEKYTFNEDNKIGREIVDILKNNIMNTKRVKFTHYIYFIF
jgi:hypothetical protein